MARRRRRRRDLGGRIGLAVLALVGFQLFVEHRAEVRAWVADQELPALGGSTAGERAPDEALRVASFNVKFVGYYPERDDDALADLLSRYDVVVVQEIVSPPYPGRFDDGTAYRPDPQSAEFFDAMHAVGFSHVLSSEDTGRSQRHHDNGAATEWFAAFYRSDRVQPAADLPHGFVADDRTANPDFDRVPHAFAFRSVHTGTDFVLVSVHLHADRRGWKRRRHELAALARWVDAHDDAEKDFIVLGDLNVQDCNELRRVVPEGYVSLNRQCRSTNTAASKSADRGRPYDHVLVRPTLTREIDPVRPLEVVDLVESMRPRWRNGGAYPGAPYRHRPFIERYSDHNPVVFTIATGADDDGPDASVLTRSAR